MNRYDRDTMYNEIVLCVAILIFGIFGWFAGGPQAALFGMIGIGAGVMLHRDHMR